MRAAVDRALAVLSRGRDAFDADDLLRGAAESAWVRLDEVYLRLGELAEDQFPEFPWRQMHAMRNVLVHRYPTINYALVWEGLAEFATLGRLLEERMALPPGSSPPS